MNWLVYLIIAFLVPVAVLFAKYAYEETKYGKNLFEFIWKSLAATVCAFGPVGFVIWRESRLV